MFFSKPATSDEFKKAFLDERDLKRAFKIAEKLFKSKHPNEIDLSIVAGLIFETRAEFLYRYLNDFTYIFPESVHPIQAFLADVLYSSGQADMATHEARLYLRRIKDRGML